MIPTRKMYIIFCLDCYHKENIPNRNYTLIYLNVLNLMFKIIQNIPVSQLYSSD